MNTSSWQGSMPSTATQVVDLQNSALSLYKKDVIDENLFHDTIYRMMALRDQLRASENQFYSIFNLPQGAEGLKVLQQRFDELNADAGFRSMSNLSDSYFDQLVASAMEKIDLAKPVNVFFKDGQRQSEFLQSDFGQQEAGAVVGMLIDAINSTKQAKASGAGRVNKSSSGSYGLSRYIGEVIIDPTKKDKKSRIQVRFDKALPAHWQSRLEEDYGFIIDNDSISREKILQNWLSQNISNAVIRNRVMYQFNNKKGAYDLNSSAASIKGFLGEVRTAAFLDHLCNRNGSAMPTGNIHEIVNGSLGGEIAIDILLKGFGFQVKNYRVTKSGNTTFMHRDAMGMGNFIIDRMRPDQGIAQLLSQFFGSWAYNQPVDGATETYQQIYSRFSNNDIEDVFGGYIDNILKVSDQFQANTRAFANEALYFNTFFVIGDKFVPSSAMLTAIIQSLQMADTDRLVSSSFSISEPTSGETWQQDEPYTSTSAIALANQVKISWYITLDMNQILDQAYSQIF